MHNPTKFNTSISNTFRVIGIYVILGSLHVIYMYFCIILLQYTNQWETIVLARAYSATIFQVVRYPMVETL